MKCNFKFFLLFFVFVFAVGNSFGQKGKKIKSKKYEYMGPYCNGLAKVKMNKKWGFVDTTGAIIVKAKYDEVGNFSEGLARVRVASTGNSTKGWGLVNTSGDEIVKPMFDWIYDFENGRAKVKISGQEAYIDKNGNLIR